MSWGNKENVNFPSQTLDSFCLLWTKSMQQQVELVNTDNVAPLMNSSILHLVSCVLSLPILVFAMGIQRIDQQLNIFQ